MHVFLLLWSERRLKTHRKTSLFFRNVAAPVVAPTSCLKVRHMFTVVLGRNYQKKNVQTKISSESVSLLVRPSEKPWFSQFELALFELFDFEFYLMKSVNRNLRFAVFLVFPKNGPLRRLLGTCLCYDQLFFYKSATLCAIFMTLAPKLWRPQWFEVGWSAKDKKTKWL